MAKKPEKVYLVHAELHRYSDIYGDEIIENHDVEQIAVTVKQAISRCRYNYGWRDGDNDKETRTVRWKWSFDVKPKIPNSDPGDPKYEQLSLFDNN